MPYITPQARSRRHTCHTSLINHPAGATHAIQHSLVTPQAPYMPYAIHHSLSTQQDPHMPYTTPQAPSRSRTRHTSLRRHPAGAVGRGAVALVVTLASSQNVTDAHLLVLAKTLHKSMSWSSKSTLNTQHQQHCPLTHSK
jgi:hypothetical protein